MTQKRRGTGRENGSELLFHSYDIKAELWALTCLNEALSDGVALFFNPYYDVFSLLLRIITT